MPNSCDDFDVPCYNTDMTAISTNSEADIFSRVVAAGNGGFTPDISRIVLSYDFDQVDKDRMHQLSLKAQQGTLTEAEEREMDNYERVGHFLSILQSKARMSLQQTTSDSE